jgi:hypothetical protein
MDHEVDPPRRLAFVEDDWQVIAWTEAVLRRAGQRSGLDADTQTSIDAFRRALLALPFVTAGHFEFSLGGVDDHEWSICIGLNDDAFELYTIEFIDRGGGPEAEFNYALQARFNDRDGPEAFELDEWFAGLVNRLKDPENEVSATAEADATTALPSLDTARAAWRRAFTD